MRSCSLVLMAMMTGLGLAAGSGGSRAQEPVVAMVNGKPITEADLRFAATEFGAVLSEVPPEYRRQLSVEYLIASQLYADAAEAAGLGTGDEFGVRLMFVMRRVLRDLFIEKSVMPAVTDADAQRLYEEQVRNPEEEVRVRHILVASEALARELRERVAAGGDFAALARAESDDTVTAWHGGDLGWRVKGELQDRLADAAFDLHRKGELSEPVQTELGWHLVMLEERRMRAVPEFAAVKDRLRDRLVKLKARELGSDLREKATILYIDPDLQPN